MTQLAGLGDRREARVAGQGARSWAAIVVPGREGEDLGRRISCRCMYHATACVWKAPVYTVPQRFSAPRRRLPRSPRVRCRRGRPRPRCARRSQVELVDVVDRRTGPTAAAITSASAAAAIAPQRARASTHELTPSRRRRARTPARRAARRSAGCRRSPPGSSPRRRSSARCAIAASASSARRSRCARDSATATASSRADVDRRRSAPTPSGGTPRRTGCAANAARVRVGLARARGGAQEVARAEVLGHEPQDAGPSAAAEHERDRPAGAPRVPVGAISQRP